MTQTTKPQAVKPPRDLRLDFFRGLAMFIILLAHTPGNTWTLWIPARFGFSDATEIFVFCSGMASALAFGTVFAKRSYALGSARVAYRVWQVYWAHIGVVLVTALMLLMLDQTGYGEEGKIYANWASVVQIWTRTQDAMVGLFTLTYIRGLFDILPMYLVILALIPVVMGIYRVAGREATFAFIIGLWLAAQLAGYARKFGDLGPEELTFGANALHVWAVRIGESLSFLNLPSNPVWFTGGDNPGNWFFNPFGWQLIFFTGFAFGMGWLPAPPVRRWLIFLCAAFVIAALFLAWNKLYAYETGYLPESMFTRMLWDLREIIEPLRWKTWQGLFRYLHFLALAYLFWVAVGAGGAKLREGFSVRPVWRPDYLVILRSVAALAAVLTIPYAYVEEIKAILPGLDAFFLANIPLVPGRWIGLLQIAHMISLMILVWGAIGAVGRGWVVGTGFLGLVPVIRKVGTQSLAVFMVSIPLSRFNGWWMDEIGRDVWTRGLVNLTGFLVLILVAYSVGWFRRQPWRQKAPQGEQNRAAAGHAGTGQAGAGQPGPQPAG